MSKKLMAVASVAALALSALVAAPASASSVNISSVTDVSGAGTLASPYTHAAPLGNELDNDGTTDGATTNTAVRFVVTSAAGKTVTITSTGSVKLLDEATDADNLYNTTSGTQSLSLATGSGTTVTFWAYSTSITAGTVVIADQGNVATVYVAMSKANAATGLRPYNLDLTVPSVGTIGNSVTIQAKVTDVFGNEITATNAGTFDKTTDLDVVIIGGGTLADSGNWTYSTVRKLWEAKVNIPAAGGVQAVGVTLQDADTAIATLAAAGFDAPRVSGFSTINSQDSAALIVTLQGQVATLQAQVADMRTKARSVTKKKYNTLARKWNAANPTARVALKK